MSRPRSTRLVQVSAPGRAADFAVTADSTFADLAPLLASRLGAGAQAQWYVAIDGAVLDPTATPAEAGVIDGDRLELTTEPSAPVRRVNRSAAQQGDARRRRFGTAST